MEFEPNVKLSQLTTFRLGGPSRLFCSAKTVEDVRAALAKAKQENLPVLVIGGGSNIVVSDDGFDGLVIKLENAGISAEKIGDDILLICSAGERWDGVVAFAVERNWWGVENLSHIPGNIGAFAVQNVGAYGQEASQVVEYLTVFDTDDGQVKHIAGKDCGFRYRSSIFNKESRGKYIILEVALRLSPIRKPNLSYPDLKKYFADRNVVAPELEEIRQAIISIRDRKFTTPDKIPNSGSFFKNSVIAESEYEVLDKNVRENFGPEVLEKLHGYREKLSGPEGIKIPSAFLIDACGLKGVKLGGAKVNETQPLVILNYSGTATARDVLALMRQVRRTVYAKTGLALMPEPELVGFSVKELEDYFSLE